MRCATSLQRLSVPRRELDEEGRWVCTCGQIVPVRVVTPGAGHWEIEVAEHEVPERVPKPRAADEPDVDAVGENYFRQLYARRGKKWPDG